MYNDRLPPQNVEAEEAVIGSLLIDGEALTRVAAVLKADDFALQRTKAAFQACQILFEQHRAINQVTVADQLNQRGLLESVGGADWLTDLIIKVPTSAHIEHYARIVHRDAMMRRLIDAAEQIRGIGYEGGPDVEDVLTKAEDMLLKLRTVDEGREMVLLKQVLDQYLEEKRELDQRRPDAPHIVPTGFFDLDKLFGGGLQRSDLVILAARPALGKSSLALNIAHNAAKKGAHVAIFTLEMSREQLADRLISSLTKVDSNRLRMMRQGQVGEVDEDTLMHAIGELSDLPIWIDDTSSPTAGEIRSKARRLYMERGLDLIIVDYMQLLTSERSGGFSGNTNRVQEMSEISRVLKGLARDLDVPVVSLSQLSRAPERPPRRPLLADLRESGSIEQDADIVMFIYREDKTLTEEEWERLHPSEPFPRGVTELIVSKHRHGATKTINLFFDESTTTFRNGLAPARARQQG